MVMFEGLYFQNKYGPQPIIINQSLCQPIATHQLLLLLLLLLLLAHLWPHVGPSWSYVVPSGSSVGPMLGHLGPILGHLGAILNHLRSIFGASVGSSWIHFAPFALTRTRNPKKINYARAAGAHYRHHPDKIHGFCISPLSKLSIFHAHKIL